MNCKLFFTFLILITANTIEATQTYLVHANQQDISLAEGTLGNFGPNKLIVDHHAATILHTPEGDLNVNPFDIIELSPKS